MLQRAAPVLACLLLSACGVSDAVTPADPSFPRPVVVQGAMDIEIEKLSTAVDGVKQEEIAGWVFWRGTLDGYPVVISKTRRGMSNASAATAIAVEHFHPAAIINQGTAGGHQPDLHVYDIVVGKESVNLGAFRTPFRARGQGSNFAEWGPIDLLRSDASVSLDPGARAIRRFPADEGLLAAAISIRDRYRKGQVVEGVIGSSDTWNSEIDRIQRLHDAFGTSAEEMETASAAQVAGAFQVPFLGIRVLSNNITNDGAYDSRTAEACQEYVLDVIRQYVKTHRTKEVGP
jgi:adenosylhomocysteine nucleosidase